MFVCLCAFKLSLYSYLCVCVFVLTAASVVYYLVLGSNYYVYVVVWDL